MEKLITPKERMSIKVVQVKNIFALEALE